MSDFSSQSGVVAPLWADGIGLDQVAQQVSLAKTRSSAVKEGNFWSTPERDFTSPQRDVIEMTLSGPRLVNFISFKTAHFPHVITAEYQDPETKTWYPLESLVETSLGTALPEEVPTSPLSLTLSDSSPAVVNRASRSASQHPQHFGANHWYYEAWKTRPVSCERVRLVLVRTRYGSHPVDPSGASVAYSLGVKDWQVGYRINSREDIPRYNTIVTEEDSFASTTDMLGSRVVYSLREQKPGRAVDGSNETSWRSEPQPVNYAVVNFYADTRDAAGSAQVIDRFFIDPLTVGPHLNLYHSDDDPDSDYDGLVDPIPYPLASTHGVAPVARIFGTRAWADMLQFSSTAPSYVDVDNSFLQFNPGKDWWVGLDVKASAGLDGYVAGASSPAPTAHPWVTFGTNVLRQRAGTIEFTADNGDLLSFTLPPEHAIGVVFRVALVYSANGDDSFAQGLTLRYRIEGHSEEFSTTRITTIARSRPATFSVGRYASTSSPGFSGLWVRGLVVKQHATTTEEVERFLADGETFVRSPQSPRLDTSATANALLRMHPLWAKTANPAGLVGGPGDRYEDMEWTPVFRDYGLKRGYLHLPPTKARFWKFEMTRLTAEHYEVFVPIEREMRMFPARVVRHYDQVSTGPWAKSDADAGVVTNAALGQTSLYSDAITRLSVSALDEAYSPTEALYLPNPLQAEQANDLGWIWRYQPWHAGSSAPRFIEKQKHFYERVRVRHKTKVGFFAGIKTLRAYRVNYGKDDDTARYDDHFGDQAHIESSSGIAWGDDDALVSLSNYAEVVSVPFGSARPVRALQFATQQSDAEQMLADDLFLDPDFAAHWRVVGDAEVIRAGPRNVVVNRGWAARRYGQVETTYPLYSNVEGHLYGEVEGGEPNGLAEGGLRSQSFFPSGSGRVYAVARLTAEALMSGPVRVEVVSADGDVVLASESRLLNRGEVADVWVGYTPGQARTMLTYADAEAQGTYGNLQAGKYGDLQSVAISGEVYARVIQGGATSDSFTVQRLSMFDNPVVWSFSVNSGATWFDAMEIRNNPNGVLTFPESGQALKWRLQVYAVGVAVSALSIRPWYAGLLAGQESHHGMAMFGPNLSVVDLFPEVEDDSMWQQWDSPIPRSWYSGLVVDPWAVDEVPSEPLSVASLAVVPPVLTHYDRFALDDVRPFGTGVSDTFTGADAATLGGRSAPDTASPGWTYTGGTYSLSANTARMPLTPFDPPVIAWVASTANAQWQVRLLSDTGVGLAFRGDGAGQNYWVAKVNGLYRYAAGVPTLVSSWSPLGAGTVLTVEATNSSIKVYANTTIIASVTSAVYRSAVYGGLWAQQ